MQVSDHLIETALHKEQGEGPDPDRIMDDMKRMRGLHSDSHKNHNGQQQQQQRGGGNSAEQRGSGGRDSSSAAERRPQGADGRAGKY